VRDRADAKALTAILQHLGHEGHAFEPAVFVQRGKNFLFAANLDEIAGAET
jgi:hypothetical protein